MATVGFEEKVIAGDAANPAHPPFWMLVQRCRSFARATPVEGGGGCGRKQGVGVVRAKAGCRRSSLGHAAFGEQTSTV